MYVQYSAVLYVPYVETRRMMAGRCYSVC